MDSITLQPMNKEKKISNKKIQRRNYFTDRTFQLTFAGNLLIVAAISMMTAGVVVAWIFVYVLNDHLSASLLSHVFLLKIGIILGCIGLGIVVWTVLRAHAIAGPVTKTRRILREAAQGRFPDRPVAFRRGDAFQGLFEDLNRCLEVMRDNYKSR